MRVLLWHAGIFQKRNEQMKIKKKGNYLRSTTDFRSSLRIMRERASLAKQARSLSEIAARSSHSHSTKDRMQTEKWIKRAPRRWKNDFKRACDNLIISHLEFKVCPISRYLTEKRKRSKVVSANVCLCLSSLCLSVSVSLTRTHAWCLYLFRCLAASHR